ncbi:MAG: cytosol nonspecific dipeptidase [Ignavibacteriae bacterium HGW-Ignavibacteriae-2]|nr:aminoacyl-histidine dipeptidase [Bacteroidota bacterium]PKL88762.1 MAG: cytosol nonspecific dipeptidase [Ignavibacteriae bacterium HGW-Ignavibacteriae-2]
MSKDVIKNLKPALLWKYFYEISQVPRPSKKEEKIREYVIDFAQKHSLEFVEDKVGNIVIKVPASKGFENKPTVVLQGHVDMVCEKNKGTNHDFDNDPLTLINEDGWIKAKGTTLGADNGIGVAAGMAAATDPDLQHGPLEILCTVDEETGLTGANALKPGFISGKILLNLDSEEDGAFYVGCSGGVDTYGVFELELTKAKKDHEPFEIMVTGLKGGHSGLDVKAGRANAIKLLAQLLNRMNDVKFSIAQISGGSKRNAIPREAEAVILIDPKDKAKVQKIVKLFVQDSLLEFNTNDGGLKISFTKKKDKVKKVFTKPFSKKIIRTLLALPHGIMAMSADIPDLVETSTNLATVTMEDNLLQVGTSQRSSIESAKENICNSVKAVFKLADASQILLGDGYPGWKPNMNSEVLKSSVEVFKKLYSKEPHIKAIHAGLECGILGDKYPGLDMISFGPTIQGAHSPDEKVNIADVEKFYNLLKGILKEI